MEGCCPNPDYPVVPLNERTIFYRRILKGLIYGQSVVVVLKFLVYKGMAGLFQLLNLWILYSTFATLHFCSALCYLILCCMEFFFVLVDIQFLLESTKEENKKLPKSTYVLLGIIALYYFLAILGTYTCYKGLKAVFEGIYGSFDEHNNREQMLREEQRLRMEEHEAQERFDQERNHARFRDLEQDYLQHRRQDQIRQQEPKPQWFLSKEQQRRYDQMNQRRT